MKIDIMIIIWEKLTIPIHYPIHNQFVNQYHRILSQYIIIPGSMN